MEAFLGKKYKLSESENFDEFMKAIGKFIIIFEIKTWFKICKIL